MGLHKLLFLIIVSLAVMLPQPVAAKSLNIKQAVAKVKGQYGGKVLGAKHFPKGKQPYFKIKLLMDNGRIKTLYVNSKNGRLSEKQP